MEPRRTSSSPVHSDVAPIDENTRSAAVLQVESLIDALAALPKDDTLRFTLRVGELICERLFDGDVHALRAVGTKELTFRLLSSHPRLPFSHAALWRAIGIYELVSRFPQLAGASHLGVTHLRAVLGLPEHAQRDLLLTAERERWTGQKLETVAAGHRASVDRRSRSNATVLMRTLKRLEQAADDAETVRSARIVEHVNLDAVRHAVARMERAQVSLRRLERALSDRLSGSQHSKLG